MRDRIFMPTACRGFLMLITTASSSSVSRVATSGSSFLSDWMNWYLQAARGWQGLLRQGALRKAPAGGQQRVYKLQVVESCIAAIMRWRQACLHEANK